MFVFGEPLRSVVVPDFAVAAPDTPQDAPVDLNLLGWECGRVGTEEDLVGFH